MLSACTHFDQQKQAYIPSVAVHKKVLKKDSTFIEQKKNYTPEFPADTIYPARILTEGTFHSDEVEKRDVTLFWVGLFKTDSNYHLAAFHIQILRVRDEIVDNEKGVKTGWEIKTGNKDSSVLLIGGLSELRPRIVLPLIKESQKLTVGKYINFTLNGVCYQLYAIGSKRILTGPQDYVQDGYKIFIKATIKGKSYNQLLAIADQVDNDMIIRFVGDLDGDNVPDLIIDTTKKENVEQPTLYLSKPATKGQLLKIMGLHTTVGC